MSSRAPRRLSSARARRAIFTAAAALSGAGCAHAPVWTASTPDLRADLVVRARGGRHCVRLEQRELGCFDGVDVHSIAFDSSGTRTALAVKVGAQWGIAVDGRVGRLWDGVGAPRLSSDGEHLAYAADSGGRWRVVQDDGYSGTTYESIVAGSLQFDAEGKQVAFVVRRGRDLVVVSGAGQSPPWRAVRRLAMGPAVARPSRRQVAYAARDSAGWHLVVDGLAGGAFEDVRDVQISPGGLVIAVARANAREAVLLAGRDVAWHDEVLSVATSPDGRVGFVVRDGEAIQAATLDGGLLAHGAISDLALGANGAAAWIRRDSTRQSIIAPNGMFSYDRIVEGTLQFVDERGSWTALIGDRARRELRIVVDGRDSGRRFDWSEVTRRLQQGAGAEGIRHWVAALARRELSREAGERAK